MLLDSDSVEASLFLERLIGDWDRQPQGLKQVWSYKLAVPVHSSCGAFLHGMELLRAKTSEAEFNDVRDSVREQFMSQLMDSDLLNAMNSNVPPLDLSAVPVFRWEIEEKNLEVSVSRVLISTPSET